MFLQKEFKLLGDNVSQRHLTRDLDAVHLELAGDRCSRRRHLGVSDHGLIGGILGYQRDH